MKASQIIAESFLCRQAARNIYPQDPDELFNTVWLKIAEREIADPTFEPQDPKYYFIRALKNQTLDWNKKSTPIEINKVKESQIIIPHQSNLPSKSFIYEWIDAHTNDDYLLFLKNILTLAMFCKNNKQAIKLIGCSDRQYYTYKNLAKKQLYADYYASNSSDLSSVDLV